MSHSNRDVAQAGHGRTGNGGNDDDGSDERDPLLGYESDLQAREDMQHDDEVLTDLNHGGQGFGSKTIGSVAGSMLLLNNMMGVGLPLLPMLVQQAGWVTPVVTILFVAGLSGLSATMLTESMKYLPGNRHFDDRVEFSSLAKFYLGRWPYVATQVVLNLALLSLNLVSILETVQVMDWTIVGIFNCTYGLTLTPTAAFQRACPAPISGSTCDSPFGDSMVIGLGYFVVIVLIIPMGYFNLDDNIVIQVVSTFIQLAILLQWVVAFFMRGFGHFQVTAFGTGQGQGAVLGNIILNYAFIMTVPSWCNEKRRSSNVNHTVWSAVGLSTACYIVIGVLGALAFGDLHGGDILTALNNASGHSIIDQISVYLFPLIAVASSIPIFSIIMRYNLVENGLCSLRVANVVAVLVPWLLVIPMTAGNSIFNSVSNFTSIAFQLPINLIVPFAIYVMAMRRKAYLKPCLCEPGPCRHDAMGSDDAEVLMPETADANTSVNVSSKELLYQHKHIKEEDGRIRAVRTNDVLVPWAEQHPRLARCCCRAYVAYKSRPAVDPLQPFSVRHPRWAALLPRRLVKFLDKESPPAPEHHALPQALPVRFKQALGITLAVLSACVFIGALSLAIWQQIDPPDYAKNNSCGLS